VVSERIAAVIAERQMTGRILREQELLDASLAAKIAREAQLAQQAEQVERELAAKYRDLPAPKVSATLAKRLKPLETGGCNDA
jgi:hypothetical protein